MIRLAVIACIALAGPALGQSAPFYTYDVVVIKPNTSGSGSSGIDRDPGSYKAENVPLKRLIQEAYGVQSADQITGLPGWASDAHYDLTAKSDAETAARIGKLTHDESVAAAQAAGQALLAERFHLKVHHESRELPEYALVQAKGGSKLKPGDEMKPNAGGMHTFNLSSGTPTMHADAVRLENLTLFLSRQLHRPVLDRTGLTGKFDMELHWTPDDAAPVPADSKAERAPGLLTALQEQLGLRLESIKGPVDMIVVDHVETPEAN